jgi:TetR/AcrR family transcriptional regulator, tetracycline repressor protein
MSRRTGAGLSRKRVVEAGLNLVDREGVGALTMRRLGRELGVEAMSLYGYVDSKKDLLDGVLERVYEELPPSLVADGPWQERLRTTAFVFRRVLLRHPNMVSLVAARPVVNGSGARLVDSAKEDLQRCGLDPVRASQVLTAIVAFTVGHVANEVGEQCSLGPDDRDASFALGLDFIVSGIDHHVSLHN